MGLWGSVGVFTFNFAQFNKQTGLQNSGMRLLWKILAKLGVPPQMIKIIKKLYTNVTYKSTHGVKQGVVTYHMNVRRKNKSFENTHGAKQGGSTL
jgi:hypothetical protein